MKSSINIPGGSTGSISINGLNITIRGSDVYVNGKLHRPVDGETATGEVAAHPEKVYLSLNSDGRVVGDIYSDLVIEPTKWLGSVTLIIEGNVSGSVHAHAGIVQCKGSVSGSVVASQDVLIKGNVSGPVNAGRDIHANNVSGSAQAGRDITR